MNDTRQKYADLLELLQWAAKDQADRGANGRYLSDTHEILESVLVAMRYAGEL